MSTLINIRNDQIASLTCWLVVTGNWVAALVMFFENTPWIEKSAPMFNILVAEQYNVFFSRMLLCFTTLFPIVINSDISCYDLAGRCWLVLSVAVLRVPSRLLLEVEVWQTFNMLHIRYIFSKVFSLKLHELINKPIKKWLVYWVVAHLV